MVRLNKQWNRCFKIMNYSIVLSIILSFFTLALKDFYIFYHLYYRDRQKFLPPSNEIQFQQKLYTASLRLLYFSIYKVDQYRSDVLASRCSYAPETTKVSTPFPSMSHRTRFVTFPSQNSSKAHLHVSCSGLALSPRRVGMLILGRKDAAALKRSRE